MRKSITRAAAVAIGACALAAAGVTLAPAATTTPTFYSVQSALTSVAPGARPVQVLAQCKAGGYMTGGGYTFGSGDTTPNVLRDH
jgi:hypothetical protein